MNNEPIRVDSRAWTGDLSIAPREYEVLSQKSRNREKRGMVRLAALAVLTVTIAACVAIDLAVWIADGRPAYIASTATILSPVPVGLACFCVALLAPWLSNLRLWLLGIVIAMSGAELIACWRYLIESATAGPVSSTTFAISRVELRHHGRRSRRFGWEKIRPEATLIDARGRELMLSGSQAFMRPLLGEDCITLGLRGVPGKYRFVDTAASLVETPYIDDITRPRHPSRCFPPPTQPR